ncbi:hypothetical protein [Gloeothece verrucosa]|nr:hypothetical protein [Gloeothece verrucosa]
MLKQTLVVFCALIVSGFGFSVWIAKSQPLSETRLSQMSNSGQIAVKSVKLISREEELPPLGVPQDPNRDIGFATVFVQLENLKEEKATLLIKSIEILNVSDGKPINFSYPSKEIHLNPLENAEIAIQLTNKTGYSGQHLVKAKIVYQLSNQIYTLESNPTEVSR